MIGNQIQVLNLLPGARKGKRGESKGEEEKRLPEERWRRVGMSESLKGRRLEEMTQSNTSFLRASKERFELQERRWQLKSPRIKRFLKEERMEGEKESVLLSVKEKRIGIA